MSFCCLPPHRNTNGEYDENVGDRAADAVEFLCKILNKNVKILKIILKFFEFLCYEIYFKNLNLKSQSILKILTNSF
jgi:hypothetical protein